MSTVANPYASPQATDLGVDRQNEEVGAEFFAFSGRLGRLRFITYGVFSAFLVMLVGGIGAAILIPVSAEFGVLLYAAFMLITTVYGFSLYIRRLHDLGQSGWWSLLMFVPLLNLALLVYLLFFPGAQGANQFGPRVRANSTGVIVAFLLSIFLGIAYVGMLAAVALPAYQDYVERAQQAR